MTYGQALALARVAVPGHLDAGAQVPVLDGPQAQGDLMIVPLDMAYEPGVLTVPSGQSAMLIHTDEHGANGIGPGRYEIRRKRDIA